MKKGIYSLMFLIFIVALCVLFINIGYNMYSIQNDIDDIKYNVSIEEDIEEVLKPSEDKITPSTKIVYKYFYKQDKVIETVEDVPPYYLIGLTRADIEKYFDSWRVISFSNKEVVLEKTVDAKSLGYYIIDEYDGNLAVYYRDSVDKKRLKEITNIPMDSLSEDEKNYIKDGLYVKGEEEVAKIIENYGS